MANLNIEPSKKALEGLNAAFAAPLFKDGEIITFTSPVIFWDDIECRIADDPNRRVRLSQLSGVYISVDNEDFGVCDMVHRNGDEYMIRNLFPADFWRLVKNRTFKVKVEEGDQYLINENNEKVREIVNYEKILDYIYDRLANEDYDAVKGMTEKSFCYSFIEQAKTRQE